MDRTHARWQSDAESSLDVSECSSTTEAMSIQSIQSDLLKAGEPIVGGEKHAKAKKNARAHAIESEQEHATYVVRA